MSGLGVGAEPQGTRTEKTYHQLLFLPGNSPGQSASIIERTSLSGCGPLKHPELTPRDTLACMWEVLGAGSSCIC